ncbi:MAG: hypothetical protein EAZ60_20390 [Oscillatoriales cyanobacterium]|nr:MAG: hypothetical protein EAZ60_20390 [Oscillatoriales cyanobacterium]
MICGSCQNSDLTILAFPKILENSPTADFSELHLLDKIAERVPKPRFLTLNQSQRMMSSLEQKIKM